MTPDSTNPLVSHRVRQTLAIGAAVIVGYVATATLGFQFAFVAEQVTTVWAPTGIAQAALLLWGTSLWPAVWLGALLANLGTDAPAWVAAVVATGNTLEAVVAVSLLRRLPGFDPALRKVSDVVAFISIGAVASTILSATIGVAALCASEVQPWTRYFELWADWWLGDALGSLVVGPALLTTIRRTPLTWPPRNLESALLVGGGGLLALVVFGEPFGPAARWHPLEFVVFPFVVTAAVRLGLAGTAQVVLLASAVAIWHTVRGVGPFAGDNVHQSLVLLQVFTGILAGTGLLLAAAITERVTGERRRAAAHAVGLVLADSADLTRAAPMLLDEISRHIGWPVGSFWLVDPARQRLHCFAVAEAEVPKRSAGAFLQQTRHTVFPLGIGLPGRVLAARAPIWIEDVSRDEHFPRAPLAAQAGLHGAFAFPVSLGDEVLGVVEFFHHAVITPDPDLLGTMATVGSQIGQFIGRKRVEAAVFDEQRRTRAILDNALDAVIGMNHEGLVTEFNPAAERTFGYRREEALGRRLAELIIPPEMREQHRAGLAHYLATGEGPLIDRRIESTASHADGHQFPVEIAITRLPGEVPPRFTGFVRDLTERAHAERERERLLERELAARREAESANRAKDEFLATLSHELRTPLNAIVGWTRILLDRPHDADGVRRALEVIARNAQLQSQLIEDILDVSRIISGGLRLDLRPVDLGAVIGAALDAVRPAAETRHVQLVADLPDSAQLTYGDPQRLQQIVWNLLSNAVKFSSAGGTVRITLEASSPSTARLTVRDNGVGIDPQFLPHVFDRFRQADGAFNRQHGGLGLGLAIVRHLAELHGGTVWAESEGRGEGSTFVVELPSLDQAETTEGLAIARSPGLDGGTGPRGALLDGCRVLVVEDDDDSRDVISAVLSSAGAAVRGVASAAEALAALDAAWPDVMLADIGMPGADGYSLIREVRRRGPEGAALPAAAVTAYASAADREQALGAGFDMHLAKPINPSEVIRAVQTLRSRP